jgi:putative DNA primase/helicase
MASDDPNDVLGRLHEASKKGEAPNEKAKSDPPLRTVHSSRLEITLSETMINSAAIMAMEWLAGARVPIYQRSGRLVRPASADLVDAEGRTVSTTVLIELNATYLKSILAKYFRWRKATRNKDKDGNVHEGWKYVSPGWDVPPLILAMQGDWPFPTVKGILSTPTLRPDGTLLDRLGLDVQTGLLLRDLPMMSGVKARPTREDAEEALKLLLELLKEFPFLDKTGRVVALSLIVSMVARGALGQVPLHLFTAPTAGSGKSFLADIPSMIATGRRAPVVAAGSRIDEQEKRIAAAMLSGRPMISLDNLTGVLSSSLLCQAVSQPIVGYRKMGGDKEIEIECRSVFVANGNNIAIADDLGRRTLFARLDAKVEKPWEREFKQKPLEMIAANRGRYIAAALTIPLAYLAAREPEVVGAPVNGFEAWSRLVRAALVWLGEADVAATMDIAREQDPKLQAKLAVFAAMVNAFGMGEGSGRTAAQMIEATVVTGLALLGEPEPKGRALKDALMGILPVGVKEMTSQRLGFWFREAKDTIVGGMQLCSEDNRTGTGRWWIERAKGKAAGDCW